MDWYSDIASPTVEKDPGFLQQLEAEILEDYWRQAGFAIACFAAIGLISGIVLHVAQLAGFMVSHWPALIVGTFVSGYIFGIFWFVGKMAKGEVQWKDIEY